MPATALLVYRAWSKKSLTPAGIVAATLTAAAHAIHPWNLPFVLLVVFFLAGSRATHVKESVKATLTLKATGSSPLGGEGPRTHVQVFANSLMASLLTLLHAYQLHVRKGALLANPHTAGSLCYSRGGDLLVIGIIANYAAVAADTFSSELGILSTGQPRLITSWNLRKVPRGTNGGVSLMGLLAGLVGSMTIVSAAMLFLPLCDEKSVGRLGGGAPWSVAERRVLILGLTVWGFLGSVLDSILGGLLQQSVRDVRTGKIVEGDGGERVLVSSSGVAGTMASAATIKASLLSGEGTDAVEKMGSGAVAEGDDEGVNRYDARNKHRKSSFGDEKPSREVVTGWDVLDNNDVNFLMAFTMSIGAMAIAGWYWGVPLWSIFPTSVVA